MRLDSALVLAAMAVSLGTPSESSAEEVDLSRELPKVLPNIASWERITGSADLDGPSRTIDYVFYVDPKRQGLYAITHYRVTIADVEDRRRAGVTASERLQWHTREGALRRFECHRASPPAPYPCSWSELAPEGSAHRNQLPLILEIYELHRRLLWARARAFIAHDP